MSRYDSRVRGNKTRRPRVEWEKLDLGLISEEHSATISKNKTKRKHYFIGNGRIGRESLIRTFRESYARVRWNLCGTMTFYNDRLKLSDAKRVFDNWTHPRWVHEGDKSWWLRITEYNLNEKTFCFHIFFKNSNLPDSKELMLAWERCVWGCADLRHVIDEYSAIDFLKAVASTKGLFEIEECDF